MTARARTSDPAGGSSGKPPSLVFYSDILGFADYVRTRPPEHVRDLLNTLKDDAGFRRLPSLGFDSLQFSDSLVVWSKDETAVSEATVDQLLSVASALLVSALARRMPLSGAIATGEFFVESRDTLPLFFGRGLVAAVEAEKAVKWVGIHVDGATARATMKDDRIQEGVRDFSWRVRESDGALLVNPFFHLTRCRGESESSVRSRISRGDSILVLELHALRFLVDTLAGDIASGRIVDARAARYLATIEFTRHMLGDEHFELASRVARELPDASVWIRSAF
jgi:hypothetical protein